MIIWLFDLPAAALVPFAYASLPSHLSSSVERPSVASPAASNIRVTV